MSTYESMLAQYERDLGRGIDEYIDDDMQESIEDRQQRKGYEEYLRDRARDEYEWRLIFR